MVIRKPKKTYEEIRHAALAHKGHLSPPNQQATRQPENTPDKKTDAPDAAAVTSADPKPKMKPPAKKRAAAPEKTAHEASAQPVELADTRPASETSAVETVKQRLTIPRLKPGVSETYDKIANAMGPEIALKATVKRALAAVGDLESLALTVDTDLFDDDKSNRLRTNRLMNRALAERLKRDLDPYDVLSDYALGLKIGQLIVATYIHAEQDTE